jgi:hypothetical protein
LICHTGKQGARDGVIDQYAARGGSAPVDGARMVAVLRAWDADAEKHKLSPPPGLSFCVDEQVIVLAPKLSFRAATVPDLAKAVRVLPRALHCHEAGPRGRGEASRPSRALSHRPT